MFLLPYLNLGEANKNIEPALLTLARSLLREWANFIEQEHHRDVHVEGTDTALRQRLRTAQHLLAASAHTAFVAKRTHLENLLSISLSLPSQNQKGGGESGNKRAKTKKQSSPFLQNLLCPLDSHLDPTSVSVIGARGGVEVEPLSEPLTVAADATAIAQSQSQEQNIASGDGDDEVDGDSCARLMSILNGISAKGWVQPGPDSAHTAGHKRSLAHMSSEDGKINMKTKGGGKGELAKEAEVSPKVDPSDSDSLTALLPTCRSLRVQVIKSSTAQAGGRQVESTASSVVTILERITDLAADAAYLWSASSGGDSPAALVARARCLLALGLWRGSDELLLAVSHALVTGDRLRTHTLVSFLVGGVLLKLRALGATRPEDKGEGKGPSQPRRVVKTVVGRVFLRVLEVLADVRGGAVGRCVLGRGVKMVPGGRDADRLWGRFLSTSTNTSTKKDEIEGKEEIHASSARQVGLVGSLYARTQALDVLQRGAKQALPAAEVESLLLELCAGHAEADTDTDTGGGGGSEGDTQEQAAIALDGLLSPVAILHALAQAGADGARTGSGGGTSMAGGTRKRSGLVGITGTTGAGAGVRNPSYGGEELSFSRMTDIGTKTQDAIHLQVWLPLLVGTFPAACSSTAASTSASTSAGAGGKDKDIEKEKDNESDVIEMSYRVEERLVQRDGEGCVLWAADMVKTASALFLLLPSAMVRPLTVSAILRSLNAALSSSSSSNTSAAVATSSSEFGQRLELEERQKLALAVAAFVASLLGKCRPLLNQSHNQNQNQREEMQPLTGSTGLTGLRELFKAVLDKCGDSVVAKSARNTLASI